MFKTVTFMNYLTIYECFGRIWHASTSAYDVFVLLDFCRLHFQILVSRVHIQSQSFLVDPCIGGFFRCEWGALYRARRFADGMTNVSVLAIETAIQADH